MSVRWKLAVFLACVLATLAGTHKWWGKSKNRGESQPAAIGSSKGTDRSPPRKQEVTHQPTVVRADSASQPPYRPRFPERASSEQRNSVFSQDNHDIFTPANSLDLPGSLDTTLDPRYIQDHLPPSREPDSDIDLTYVQDPPSSTLDSDIKPPTATKTPETTSEQPSASQRLRGRIILSEPSSFWTLSEQAYGSAIFFKALFVHNQDRIARPDLLQAGDEIDIPDLDVLRARYPQHCPVKSNGFRTATPGRAPLR